MEDRKGVLDTASKSHNTLLEIYTVQFNKLKPDKKKKVASKNKSKSSTHKEHSYEDKEYNYEHKNSAENILKRNDEENEIVDLSSMSLRGDEEIKEGKGIKILAPSKLLTRLLVLLAQIEAGNNS